MQNSIIDYWSYSSMSGLMRNPLNWKKTYVLKVYDNLRSPSSVVGNAGHKALEMYYNGKEAHEAIQAGLDYIDAISDSEINYGKTGTREKIINEYTQAINFYFEDMPTYHEIIGVEYGIVTDIKTVDGQKLALPAKAKMDLITRNSYGEIEIVDHKFVKSYSDGDVDVFGHFLQAMFNYHTIKEKFGEAPKRIIFNECKISKNRDNTPQIQPYTIEFEGQYADFATFYALYDACTRFINRDDAIFLPNPSDIFDGQNSFEIFRSGIIGVDRPTEVKHKTEMREFTEKNFVPSALDKVENASLSIEEKIRLKLAEFGAIVQMAETHVGANIIQYTMKPARGVSMAKISKLVDDVALAIEAPSIRIEAPIRGTSLVGIEVANPDRKRIDFADQYLKPGTLNIPVGIDVYGKTVHKDLADMPHLLIAGATGSGKSVMLNVILTALTKQMKPADMQLILIDPKRVELSQFAKMPHLLMPVVYEDKEAAEVLQFAVEEMEKRYEKLMEAGVRTVDDYKGKDMPKLVIVIDEFADLMQSGGKQSKKAVKAEITERDFAGKPVMKYRKEIEAEKPSSESLIVRLAQKARAVGIHVILATQRPSADVVTGLIKANVPTKIAFMTTNKINSQIVLDVPGAEELTGKGDMLFQDPSNTGLKRLQGLYI